MNDLDIKEENQFAVLRKIGAKPNISQREIASELGFSLGKLNYCIKELRQKGLIKIKNFEKKKKKMKYLYLLTPKGLTSKTILTVNFMKKKMREYDELRNEFKKMKNLKKTSDKQLI